MARCLFDAAADFILIIPYTNYIFIIDLTPGLNEMGKENGKTRQEIFKFLDLVCLTLEVLRYTHGSHYVVFVVVWYRRTSRKDTSPIISRSSVFYAWNPRTFWKDPGIMKPAVHSSNLHVSNDSLNDVHVCEGNYSTLMSQADCIV